MTKTQISLLSRKGKGRVLVTGARECNAAQGLVKAGLARSFENKSEFVAGRTYFNCFTRSYTTSKAYTDVAGFITF